MAESGPGGPGRWHGMGGAVASPFIHPFLFQDKPPLAHPFTAFSTSWRRPLREPRGIWRPAKRRAERGHDPLAPHAPRAPSFTVGL